MIDPQAPTLIDIAKMIESPTTTEPHPETVPVVLWLIEQSPPARALYAELTRARDDGPTALELAKLLFAVECGGSFPEAQRTGIWLARQSEIGRELYAELEQMAADERTLPTYPSWPTDIVRHNQQVDALVADSEWQDAAEVLDPLRDFGASYETWHAICHARLARGAGNRRALRATLEKLRQNLELQRKAPTLDERADKFREWVKELGDPEATAKMFTEIAEGIHALKRRSPG